jgi:D-glycero-D-manno-heptose 1,7-bisphosphate phosphatase
MPGHRAVFLDRDGVLNELVYIAEHGRVDTPLTPEQFRLIPGVSKGIKVLRAAGFHVYIASNQPGIAKGQFSPQVFDRIRQKTRELLERDGAHLDGEYYCLHHPDAITAEYRQACDCRKPKPGLILRAAEENSIEIPASFMVGDGLTDVEAGRTAGCQTVLIAHLSSLLTQLMDRKQLFPTYLSESFDEAVRWILEQ